MKIPDTWEWVALGNICELSNGISKRKADNGTPTIVLRLADLDEENISLLSTRKINLSEKEITQYKLEIGDLLFIRVNGSKPNVGKPYVYSESKTVAYCDHLMRGSVLHIADSNYLCLALRSTPCKTAINRLIVTTAGQNTISQLSLNSVMIPLPPLTEQHRIVDAIESAFTVIDEIERNKSDMQSAVAATKQRILSLAISGKLVPQDPNDEPASVLLERIRTEREALIKAGKIKRGKTEKEAAICRDNSHYDGLPDRWEVARLSDICSIITDGTHQTPTYVDEGYTFLSSKNVTTGKIDWKNVMYIPESLHNVLYARLAPEIGDILIAKNGTTGYAAIVDRNCIFDIYVSLALLRTFKNEIMPEYLRHIISSQDVQNHFKGNLKGIGVPNLHLEHIRTALIPICSLTEQRRIVSTIEAAFEQLDSILSMLT